MSSKKFTIPHQPAIFFSKGRTTTNESKKERPVGVPVAVKIGQRQMRTDCVVGEPRSEALIGQIVLEELDLIVDCKERTLKPNPQSPYLPMLKMK